MAKPNQTDRTNQKPKKTKNKQEKTKRTKWQDPTLCHYFPPGVCNLVFFVFFWFLVFLVSWFCVFVVSCFLVRCWWFEGLVKQHKSEGPGLTLCQFSHFRDRPNKPKTTKKETITRLNSLPLLPPWVCNLVFFGIIVFLFLLVSCFLFSWFLVFWFVVGGLKGWQNNAKVKDPGLTLCQFSHFRGCKRAFAWFYCLRWACGSIWKPCKIFCHTG